MYRWFRILGVLVILIGIVSYVVIRKETLTREAAQFLQDKLRRETLLDVRVGKVGGNFLGEVTLEEVLIENQQWPVGSQALFAAERIRVRYRLQEFLSKKFASKIEVVIEKPVWHCRSFVRTGSGSFPFFDWMKRWALTQRDRWKLSIQDLEIIFDRPAITLEDIDVVFENDRFMMTVPVRHWDLAGADVSTEFNLEGHFEREVFSVPEVFVGEIKTEGTVVNWTPLNQESHFSFRLSKDNLWISGSDFLGGIQVDSEIDFSQETAPKTRFLAKNYSLENLSPFFGPGPTTGLPKSIDLDLMLTGDWSSPQIESRVRLFGGVAGNSFKMMNIYVKGLFPTMMLSDSHLVMEDGTVMSFADQVLEIRDLFSKATYTQLISDAQQSKVVVGHWGFETPKDAQDIPEVSMRRVLAENLSLQVKKDAEEDESKVLEDNPVEVGVEFQLKADDYLTVGVRDEEKFFGIERKTKF